jgi:hypothetical protein
MIWAENAIITQLLGAEVFNLQICTLCANIDNIGDFLEHF